MTNLLTPRTSPKSGSRRSKHQLARLANVAASALQLNVMPGTTRVIEMNVNDERLDHMRVLAYKSCHATPHGTFVEVEVADADDTTGDCSPLDDLDTLPSTERMRSLGRYDERDRRFGYGPLRAFLDARVGQPITEVTAELTKRAGTQYPSRRDLMDTFRRRVKHHVTIGEDGRVYDMHSSSRTYMPTDRLPNEVTEGFYVHPSTGTLEKLTEAKPEQKLTYEQVKVDATHKLVKLDGLWYMVTFAPLLPASTTLDEQTPKCVVTGRYAIDYSSGSNWLDRSYAPPCVQDWGDRVYATAKRSANSHELRRHGVRG